MNSIQISLLSWSFWAREQSLLGLLIIKMIKIRFPKVVFGTTLCIGKGEGIRNGENETLKLFFGFSLILIS